jgi:hypothetical protein
MIAHYIRIYCTLLRSSSFSTVQNNKQNYTSVYFGRIIFNIYLEDKNSEPNCNSFRLSLICP